MKVTLVGVQEVNFTDEKSGNTIEGIKIHFLATDENVEGHKSDTAFIRENVCKAWGLSVDDLVLSIDTAIDIEYGPRNKIVGIDLLTV